MITDRLQAAFGLVKPGVQLPTIIQVPDATLTRARELESYGAYTGYIARYTPHIVADVDEEAAKRIKQSGLAAIQWYDEPTHPMDSPFHATIQDIQNRIQARLATTRAGAGAVRARLGASTPFPIDLSRDTIVTLEDVRVATRSKDVFDQGLDGKGVTVAILDTGIDASHPMLEGQVVHAESFVPETAGTDLEGHGCITPTAYITTTISGAERIDRTFDEAKARFGSVPSAIGGHTSESVMLPPGDYVAGVRLGQESRRKATKEGSNYFEAVGEKAELTAIHKIPYRGKLVTIRSGHHSWSVTPWHPMLLGRDKLNPSRPNKWHYVRADAVALGDYLAGPTPLAPEAQAADDGMLYLLGYIVGDGHVTRPFTVRDPRRPGKTSERAYVLLSQAQFLTPLLDKLGYRYHIRKTGDVGVHKRSLWDYAVYHGIPQGIKSHTVKMPYMVVWGPNLWPFLAGYIDADGSFDKNRHRLRMRTSSEALAKQLTAVLAARGISAAVDVQIDTRVRAISGGRPTHANGPSYCISVSNKDLSKLMDMVGPHLRHRAPRVPLNTKTHNKLLRVTSIEVSDYDGVLYDLSTSTGNYLAGETAQTVIHNTWCGACIAGQPTPYQGKLDQFRGQVLQGMAPGAKLWDGKVLAGDGSGAASGILRGIEAAVDAGVQIISMSLGSIFGAGGQAPDAQAVNAATKRGVLCAVASGNSYGWLTIGSPGSAVGAITVGAHSLRAPVPNVVSLFSSKGPTTAGVPKPNLGAPGGNLRPTEVILGATAHGSLTAQQSGDGNWALEAGSSMATPCVAGILAQLLPAGFPTDRGQVEEALARGTKSRIPVKNNRLGWGPIDAVALQGAIGRPAGPVLAAYAGLLRGRGAPLAGMALSVAARAQRLPVDVNAIHLPLL